MVDNPFRATLLRLLPSFFLSAFLLSQPADSAFIAFLDRNTPKDFAINSDDTTGIAPLLKRLNCVELSLMRNAFFARHGLKFKDQQLRSYFTRFGWYKPVKDSVALTPNELSTVDLLHKMEAIQRDRFQKFLLCFRDTVLPISIGKGRRFEPSDRTRQGDLEVSMKYLSFFDKFEDRSVMDDWDFGRPPEYPWFKIVRPTFVAVCVLMQHASDEYTLCTFALDGELLSREGIATYSGDVGGEYESDVVIDPSFVIDIKRKKVLDNEYGREETPLPSKKFKVTSRGAIIVIQ